MGAAFGSLFASGSYLVPRHEVAIHIYTLVGMGAFLGAATSAPSMAIIMIRNDVELYLIVLLIVASVRVFLSRTLAAVNKTTLNRERDENYARPCVHASSELVRPNDNGIAHECNDW